MKIGVISDNKRLQELFENGSLEALGNISSKRFREVGDFLSEDKDSDLVLVDKKKLLKLFNIAEAAMEKPKLKIDCFGDFLCYPQNKPTEHIVFRTSKAEEMFALLVRYKGRLIPKDVMIDALWPDMDFDKVDNHFYVTCSNARKALAKAGFEGLIVRERGSYRLDVSRVECDLYEFLNIVDDPGEKTLSKLKKASKLYKGEYFKDCLYDHIESTREGLRREFKKVQMMMAESYICSGERDKAIEALNHILDEDPYDEEAVTRIIGLRKEAGDTFLAFKLYNEYKKRLEEEFDTEPSPKVTLLVNSML